MNVAAVSIPATLVGAKRADAGRTLGARSSTCAASPCILAAATGDDDTTTTANRPSVVTSQGSQSAAAARTHNQKARNQHAQSVCLEGSNILSDIFPCHDGAEQQQRSCHAPSTLAESPSPCGVERGSAVVGGFHEAHASLVSYF